MRDSPVPTAATTSAGDAPHHAAPRDATGTDASWVDPLAAVFPGDSGMAARCRAFDWAATPLGPAEAWPPHLRVAAGVVFASGFSMALYYGPDAIHVYNDACVPSLGAHHPAAFGRPLFETFPEARAVIAPLHARVWRGETVTLADQAVPMRRDGVLGESVWTFSYAPLRDEHGAIAGVLVTAVDMSARVADEARLRAAEARQAFLLALNDRLRPLTDPVEIQAAATRALGEHLGVARVGYGEVDAAQAHVTVHRDWGDGRIPSVVGTWRLDDFGSGFTASLKAGHTLLIPDVRCDPRTAAADVVARYDAVGTRAFLGVQLVKHGRLVALLFINHPAPRAWPTDEVALVEETCARLWAAVERARAEAALAASDARYQALRTSLDAAFCVVEVLVDADGAPADYRFLETNPAFAQQTGLADPVGRTAREVVPGLEEYWVEAYGRVARTGEPLRLEDDAAGLGRRFEVFAFRVDAPAARHVAVLVTDVTAARAAVAERERLLGDAEAARREADAANLAKSQFLASMSHELRTPLNAIGGYAELMDLGLHGPVTEAQRMALARIQASQRHLLGLITGVLDYARVEAGAVAYRLTDVSVAEAVAEAEVLVAPQLRAKGLGYAWAGAPSGLRVRADREKLQQILLNLLGNAVKFTHARDGAPGRIEVSCTVGEAAGRVQLHVGDTGVGIAADQLERVFEPFVQADQRLTRASEGIGLGLAISRDLARGMGGDLTAESTPGVGSTFTLTLPAGRMPAA